MTYQGRPDPNTGAATGFTNMYGYGVAGATTAKILKVTRGSSSTSLDADYTYDNEGHVTSVTYPTGQASTYVNGFPTLVAQAGPTYSYTYDSMGRLNTMAQTAGPQYQRARRPIRCR